MNLKTILRTRKLNDSVFLRKGKDRNDGTYRGVAGTQVFESYGKKYVEFHDVLFDYDDLEAYLKNQFVESYDDLSNQDFEDFANMDAISALYAVEPSNDDPWEDDDYFGEDLVAEEELVDVVDSKEVEDAEDNDYEKVYDFPSWAVFYAMYGKGSYLTEEEKEMVDSFMYVNGYTDLVEVSEEITDFCRYPAFGEPTEVYDWVLFHKRKDAEISDSSEKVSDAEYNYAKGGNYTHYAVNKETNLIIDGWDYHGYDGDELRQFKRDYFFDDLEETFDDIDLKRVTILTEKGCMNRGIDPFKNDNWSNEYPLKN